MQDHSIANVFREFLPYTTPDIGVYFDHAKIYNSRPLNKILYDKDFL